MTARLLVTRANVGITVQDCGRKGFRALGVPLAGALDAPTLAAANLLAGAPQSAAGLEILLAGPILRVAQGALRLGLAGEISGVLTRVDGAPEHIGSWRSLILRAGDEISLRLGRGAAYVGFSGGLGLPHVLGARATFARGGFGGLNGRALEAGDILVCEEADAAEVAASPLAHPQGPLRYIPGPQSDHFTKGALDLFTQARWIVARESDRMGLRLAGPCLAHGPKGANIVSDGATPGAIQVPGDGQPIVLRADGQTSGGYAKIGCVISADLPRLAYLAPGDEINFDPVDHAQAAAARREARENFVRWRERITRLSGSDDRKFWDDRKLWTENLISGATSGE